MKSKIYGEIVGRIDVTWRCLSWWRRFQQFVQRCKAIRPQPFSAEWIPAHQLEQVPLPQITDELASKCNTKVIHIRNNRIADNAARSLAHRLSPVIQEVQCRAETEILRHQRWLTQLHLLLPTEDIQKEELEQPAEFPAVLTPVQGCVLYPQWHWNTQNTRFRRVPKIPLHHPPPKTWKHGTETWRQVLNFFCLSDGLWPLQSRAHFVNLRSHSKRIPHC